MMVAVCEVYGALYGELLTIVRFNHLIISNRKAMKTPVCILLMFVLIGFISCDQESESVKQLDLKGDVVYRSSCKSGLRAESGSIDVPDTLSRVEYSYDGASNILSVRHLNAGFNCCPDSVYCTISLSGDTILVNEHETYGLCNSNCLYDLGMEITNVLAKKYQVKFVEPFIGDNEPLLFEVDLSKRANGSFSVVRKQYPWGRMLYL